MLVPTRTGLELIATLRRRRDVHLAAVVSEWPAADLEQLVALLDRFITDFETAPSCGVETATP